MSSLTELKLHAFCAFYLLANFILFFIPFWLYGAYHGSLVCRALLVHTNLRGHRRVGRALVAHALRAGCFLVYFGPFGRWCEVVDRIIDLTGKDIVPDGGGVVQRGWRL